MSRTPISGDVWYSLFPKEEDKNDLMERPCIIVEEYEEEYLVIKITRHDPRTEDPFDTEIVDWSACGLKSPSTARISKVTLINKSQILNYKGHLTPYDEFVISEKLDEFINLN